MPNDRDATVVVTRPRQDASALIDALRERGRRVLALPVLAIEPLDDPAPLVRALARVADYRLVVFVSPNAIREALRLVAGPWPHGTAIGVMGPGSVEALARAGLEAPACRVVAPDGAVDADATAGLRFDSEALFGALERDLGLGHGFDGRVLIVRGNGGRGWLATRLRALGIAVDEVEAYRRACPDADDIARSELARLFAARAPVAFVVTSSEGVANLVSIVERALAAGAESADVRAWLLHSTMVVPHRRIAERAREVGFDRLTVCAPGDRGILAAIE